MSFARSTIDSASPWFRSSHSNGAGGECVEAAFFPDRTAVRDSKHSTGPRLAFQAKVWADFVAAIGRGELSAELPAHPLPASPPSPLPPYPPQTRRGGWASPM